MRPILVLQHSANEGPADFGRALDARGLPWQWVRLDRGEPVPGSVLPWSGICSLGGTMSANDPLPFIDHELALLSAAFAAGTPVIGHCLGGQLMARALGASVRRNEVQEVGWHPLLPIEGADAVPPALARAWRPVPVFQWHRDTFALPAGTVPLWRSAHCALQGFLYRGVHLALQCHLEVDAATVRRWVEVDGPGLPPPSASVQSTGAMLDGLEARLAAVRPFAEELFSWWLQTVVARAASA